MNTRARFNRNFSRATDANHFFLFTKSFRPHFVSLCSPGEVWDKSCIRKASNNISHPIPWSLRVYVAGIVRIKMRKSFIFLRVRFWAINRLVYLEPYSQSPFSSAEYEYAWLRAFVYIFIPFGRHRHTHIMRYTCTLLCLDRVHYSYFVTYLPRLLFRISLRARIFHSNLENMLPLRRPISSFCRRPL